MECHLVICRGPFELPKGTLYSFLVNREFLLSSFGFWAVAPRDSNCFLMGNACELNRLPVQTHFDQYLVDLDGTITCTYK